MTLEFQKAVRVDCDCCGKSAWVAKDNIMCDECRRPRVKKEVNTLPARSV